MKNILKKSSSVVLFIICKLALAAWIITKAIGAFINTLFMLAYKKPLKDLWEEMVKKDLWQMIWILGMIICVLLVCVYGRSSVLADSTNKMTFSLPVPTTSNWTLPQAHILKGTYNEYQYKYTDYAWNTYKDKEFLLLLAAENGLFSHDRKSLCPGEASYGFCQINKYYHPEIVNDPRFFTDPQWQIDQCYKLFTSGTTFYGYERIKTDSKFRADRVQLFNF